MVKTTPQKRSKNGLPVNPFSKMYLKYMSDILIMWRKPKITLYTLIIMVRSGFLQMCLQNLVDFEDFSASDAFVGSGSQQVLVLEQVQAEVLRLVQGKRFETFGAIVMFLVVLDDVTFQILTTRTFSLT